MPKSQQTLQKVVLRMCREHPFHSLYQLYCLLPERNIADHSRRQSGRLATPTTPSTQTERGSAAQGVFDRLRNDTTVRDKVTEVERLCTACWQWAKHPLGKGRYNRLGATYQIPTELLICRLPSLRVPVPTITTRLDPTMRYDNCICVEGFEKQFTTAGGVNLPKISVCKGSDGKRYKQLVRFAASLGTPSLTTNSSKARVMMIYAKMQLWSKSLMWLMLCYVGIGRPNVAN